jgi:hypothetical protein
MNGHTISDNFSANWKAMWVANRKEVTRDVFIKRKYLKQLLLESKRKEKQAGDIELNQGNHKDREIKNFSDACAVFKQDI